MTGATGAGIASPTVRNAGIDAARAIAILSTVWMHTIGWSPTLSMTSEWGRYAVPLFNLLAGWFLVSRERRRPTESVAMYSTARFGRLYVPFLVWNLIYVVARQVKNTWLTGEPPVSIQPEILLIGTAQHMWYLPFLLMWSVAAVVVVRWAIGKRGRECGLAAALLVMGLVIAILPEPEWYRALPLPPYFLERTWVRLPSLLWGLGAGLLATPAIRRVRLPRAGVAVGIALTAACIAGAQTLGYRSLLQNTAGIGLVLFGLAIGPGQPRHWLAWLGRYAYGVFLSHTLFIETTRSMTELAGLDPATWLDVTTWAVAVVAAVAVTALANRHRLTRWLLPM